MVHSSQSVQQANMSYDALLAEDAGMESAFSSRYITTPISKERSVRHFHPANRIAMSTVPCPCGCKARSAPTKGFSVGMARFRNLVRRRKVPNANK